MARPEDRIDEERVCIDSLVQYMHKLPGCPDVLFREESDDPPDFWLSVAGREFAVEVTAITTGADYHNRTRELLQAVKEDRPSDCTRQGAYALQISRRPEIPKRNSKAWKQLVAQASSTISSLVSQPAEAARTLLSDGRGKLQIVKLSEKSDFGFNLGLVATPEPKYEVESVQELSAILMERIASKKEKISKKGVLNVCPDVILALYDTYGYCSPDQARAALSSVQGYDEWVHSIFWAASFSDTENRSYPDSPGRIGCFLFTKEESWKQ